MWARTQTLPPHCEESGSKTRVYLSQTMYMHGGVVELVTRKEASPYRKWLLVERGSSTEHTHMRASTFLCL